MKSKVLLVALAAMLAGGAMAQDCTFFSLRQKVQNW